MKKISKRVFLLVFIGLLLFVVITFYQDNYTFETTTYRVSYVQFEDKGLLSIENSDNKSELYNVGPISEDSLNSLIGKKVVQISDLHNMDFGSNLLDEIDRISPDYIFLTGDMVSATDRAFDGFFKLIEYIGNKYECYYISGNHDLALQKECQIEISHKLDECGIKVIDSEYLELLPHVYLYGLGYSKTYSANGNTFTVNKMNEELGERPKNDDFVILITHDPNNFKAYSSWGANLVFAGHTHGGMIRLFGKGLFASDGSLYPDYAGGMFLESVSEEHTNAMIVSRGLSRGSRGFRFLNTPELVVFEF